MDISVIFQFLKDLAANNNREWFNAHRDYYEAARSKFDHLLSAVISRIALFDESVRCLEPKDCTYRIYRDTRFRRTRLLIRYILAGISTQKGKSLIIADIMCICSRTIVCWQEAVIVCRCLCYVL